MRSDEIAIESARGDLTLASAYIEVARIKQRLGRPRAAYVLDIEAARQSLDDAWSSLAGLPGRQDREWCQVKIRQLQDTLQTIVPQFQNSLN